MRFNASALLLLAALVGCAHDNAARRDLQQKTATHSGLSISLDISSAIVGERQTVVLHLARHGTPLDGAAVAIAWGMTGMPMHARPAPLAQSGAGAYDQPDFSFSMPGVWHARVEVRDTGGLADDATFDVSARE